MGSHVVAIIPARYESTRLPGKPLALIDGKPMIQHVYERTARVALRRSRAGRDRRRAHRRRGARLRRRRGDDAAPIIASGTDRIAEVASDLDADVIVNVQGDLPFLEAAMVDAASRRCAPTRRCRWRR